ncbi:MAG: hypothetical protein EBU50_03715, partial [Opitutae bacterium]|nr:hypothetical protein [Opitutae bacterium]
KISGQDREGKPSSSAQILVDSAREITFEEATNYVPNMSKAKKPKLSKPKEAKPTKSKKSDENEALNKRLYIKLADNNSPELLVNLKAVIDSNTGDMEVVLVMGDLSNRQIIKLPMKIKTTM